MTVFPALTHLSTAAERPYSMSSGCATTHITDWKVDSSKGSSWGAIPGGVLMPEP